MKKKLVMALAVCAVLALAIGAVVATNCSNGYVTKGDKDKLDTLSYSIGANVGSTFTAQFTQLELGDVNLEKAKEGLKGGLLGKADMTIEEARENLDEYFKLYQERRAEFDTKKETDSTLVFVPFKDSEESDKVVYAIGVNTGEELRKEKMPLQYYWVLKAFDDASAGKLEITENELGDFVHNYFTVVRPAETKARSEKWLAKMEKKSGVKKCESGLLYKVIEEGDMTQAASDDADIVTCNFVGKNMDGEVFMANRFEDRPEEYKKMMRKQYPNMFDENGKPKKEDEPLEIALNRVFPGFAEGAKLVGVGGKIKLYIPTEMAFGEQGSRGGVEPNEAIELDVEIISVVSVKAAAERSEKWLAEKALEEGVQKTESGLLYTIIQSGNMKKAAKNDEDEVEVYYVGKLQDGTVFDSRTAEAGEPIKFPLNRVIKGWTEGMKLVGPGGKIKLYIPASMAYGATGAGASIGPNEALEFEVELVSVTPAKKK